MGFGCWKKEAAPFGAMVFVETGGVVITLLYKKAMNKGMMSPYVFVVYYNLLGLLILLPHFLFRTLCSRIRNEIPPLTSAMLWRIFVLGLIGKVSVVLVYLGTDFSSPVLNAALSNLTPIFTFLIAIIFRMENLDLRSRITQAKSLGTILAVVGALVITLYKGPEVMFQKTTINLHGLVLLPSQSNWVLGGLLLAISSVLLAAWVVLLAKTLKEYADETNIIFYFVVFGTLQCAILALIIGRSLSAWVLHYSIEIIAILFAAIFGTAIRYNVLTFCVRERGPLYVALFRPLGMVIAEIGGILVLGDALHLGSVIGAIIIAIGFYTQLWGQAKGSYQVDDQDSYTFAAESSDQNAQAPLLRSYNREEA